MSDEFAIVQTVADTSGGNQDITSGDITDFSCAIIILSGTTSQATNTAHARVSYGVCDDLGNERCLSWRAEDGNTAVPETVTWGSVGRVIQVPHPTATSSTAPEAIGTATAIDRATSGIANGIRINWDNTPVSAFQMTVILFGGLTSQAVGHGSPPASATSENVGFRPDAVLFASMHGNIGTPTGSTLDMGFGLGFAVDTAGPPQTAIYGIWDNATEPTDADAIAESDRAGGEMTPATPTAAAFAVTTFESMGWQWQRDSGTPLCIYLALEFSDARASAVALETLPGGTGNQGFTGLGIKPKLVLGAANLLTSSDSATDGATAAVVSFFAFTDTAEQSHSIHEEEGITISNPPVTNAQSRSEATALWVYQDDGATAVDASRVSMDSSGFTLNFTNATAGRMVVLAFQDPSITSVVGETVEIGETVVTRLFQAIHVLPDPVEISEETLLITISPQEANEGIDIAEGVVTVPGAVVVINEGIDISEAMDINLVSADVTEQPRRGATFEGGAARAITVEGGSPRGFTDQA